MVNNVLQDAPCLSSVSIQIDLAFGSKVWFTKQWPDYHTKAELTRIHMHRLAFNSLQFCQFCQFGQFCYFGNARRRCLLAAGSHGMPLYDSAISGRIVERITHTSRWISGNRFYLLIFGKATAAAVESRWKSAHTRQADKIEFFSKQFYFSHRQTNLDRQIFSP